jgi:hypothetical protein
VPLRLTPDYRLGVAGTGFSAAQIKDSHHISINTFFSVFISFEDTAGAERHAGQRVVGNRDREPGSVPDYQVEIGEQRPASGQHDALIDDVSGELRGRVLERHLDGLDNRADRFGETLGDLTLAQQRLLRSLGSSDDVRSGGCMVDVEGVRKLASWYREFAEKTGNPTIWELRLRTAKDLEEAVERMEREGPQRDIAAVDEDAIVRRNGADAAVASAALADLPPDYEPDASADAPAGHPANLDQQREGRGRLLARPIAAVVHARLRNRQRGLLPARRYSADP